MTKYTIDIESNIKNIVDRDNIGKIEINYKDKNEINYGDFKDINLEITWNKISLHSPCLVKNPIPEDKASIIKFDMI